MTLAEATPPDGDMLALDRQVCFALAVANRAVLSVYRAEIYPTAIRSRGGGFAAGASKAGGVAIIGLVTLGIASWSSTSPTPAAHCAPRPSASPELSSPASASGCPNSRNCTASSPTSTAQHSRQEH